MTSANAPMPFGTRALLSLLVGFGMAAHVYATWTLTGFGLASNLRGTRSETVGYSAIVVGPAGAALAFVLALLVGLFPFGARPWLRWAILATLFTFAGPATFFAIAR